MCAVRRHGRRHCAVPRTYNNGSCHPHRHLFGDVMMLDIIETILGIALYVLIACLLILAATLLVVLTVNIFHTIATEGWLFK